SILLPSVQRSSAFESTPIVVDGRLFFTTPRNRVIALDPETGRELWTFDPKLERGGVYANMWINRGVAYWHDPQVSRSEPQASEDHEGGSRSEPQASEVHRASSGACAARVFIATLDARLFALDAATGQPCADFGASGTVNLRGGIAPLYDPRE